VTGADLDRLVNLIRSQHIEKIVWVDDRCKAWVVERGQAPTDEIGLGSRRFDIPMSQWGKRPSEAEVLHALLRQLDFEDSQPVQGP
jgi:hypothetical protein